MQILILLCHSLWSKVFQSFKGLNCGFEQYWTLFHRKKNRSLIQNVKLDFCWCMVKEVQRTKENQKLMCDCPMTASRNHVCQTLYFGIDYAYGQILRENRLAIFSTCGYLSIYLWFWVQIFLLFWHSLWPNCRRDLCLVILRVLLWSSGTLKISIVVYYLLLK